MKNSQREVAVTFDDLPLQPPIRELNAIVAITQKLLRGLTDTGISAVGFVNEGKLYDQGRVNDAGIAVLRMWLDAGHNLGNHTFSHCDLNNTPLPVYFDDIVRGELITRDLLRERGLTMTYFRHPYLQTGADANTKRGVENFLFSRGYEIAPVTIASQEWAFAMVYDEAKRLGDQRLMQRVGKAYVPYMERFFKHAEDSSIVLFGYEIKQVLLLHASALNADYFNQLALMIKKRGYNFIPLSRALEDEAFCVPDSYVGPVGLSWLYRWAIGMGKSLNAAPAEPAFVMRLLDQFELYVLTNKHA